MSLKDSLYDTIDGNRMGHAFLTARRVLREEKSSREPLSTEHEFIDRSSGSENLCIILAGYKEDLWDDVFGRIAAYAPADLDICIMTSGLKNRKLQNLAEKYGWSYLSTTVNHLSLIQNITIEEHPHAKWIYKLDEDMFISKNFFTALKDTYRLVVDDSFYLPAFVSPLINVSCYGHLRLLEKCGLIEDFRATGLTDMKITDGLHHNKAIIEDARVARYMWGDTQPMLRDVDALTERFSRDKLSFTVCPTRYSIGAILFTREAWEDFGRFPLTFVGSEYGLGDDEEHICHYACFTGRAMIVSENSVAGHLGYGPQTKEMVKYYLDHKDRFAMPAGSIADGDR